MRLFLIFNHMFTEQQEADARASLGVDAVRYMPGDVQKIWGGVPPDLEEIASFLAPVGNWLLAEAAPGDHVLIQGDFGACYLMVNFAFANGLVPVYATTQRESVEAHRPDGSVEKRQIFRHKRFRNYENPTML